VSLPCMGHRSITSLHHCTLSRAHTLLAAQYTPDSKTPRLHLQLGKPSVRQMRARALHASAVGRVLDWNQHRSAAPILQYGPSSVTYPESFESFLRYPSLLPHCSFGRDSARTEPRDKPLLGARAATKTSECPHLEQFSLSYLFHKFF